MDMTVDASPMLKGMLNLLDTSIMLILRPIGDFIGFMLRPILVFFLQNVAIPFYRYFTPWMQKYGGTVGEALTNVMKWITGGVANTGPSKLGGTGQLGTNSKSAFQNLRDNLTFGGLFDQASPNYIFKAINPKTLADAWGQLVAVFQGIDQGTSSMLGAWDKLYGFFAGVATGTIPLNKAWSIIVETFTAIGNGIFGTLLGAWDKIYAFFSGLGTDYPSLGKAWTTLTTFFSNVLKDIINTLQPVWTVFMKFWTAVQTFINNIIKFIQNPIGSIESIATSNLKSNAKGVQGVDQFVIQTLNVTGLQLGADAQSFLKDPVGFVTKAIQQIQSKVPRSS